MATALPMAPGGAPITGPPAPQGTSFGRSISTTPMTGSSSTLITGHPVRKNGALTCQPSRVTRPSAQLASSFRGG
jgi:hypothetical protein